MAQHYIKKIFSDSIVYSIGYFLNRLMPFLLMPVYTYYFSPKEYGVYSLFYSFWMFVVIFYLFGMETSFQKFFIEEKSDEGKKKIFSTSLILITVVALLLSSVIFLASSQISKLVIGSTSGAKLVKIIALLMVVDSIARLPMILLNSLERSKLYTTINLAVMAVNVAANIIFIVYLKAGIEAIFYSYLISYAVLFTLSFIFSGKYFSLKPDLKILKQLSGFAFSFLLYGLFLMTMDIVDRFILEYYKGTEQVGIYSACYRIGVVMNLLILGFRTAWTPFFLNLKDEENNKEIFARVFSYFCFAGLLLFLILSFFINDLIQLKIYSISILDEKYWSGLSIIPYILLAYLFFGLFTNLNVAAYFENKIKFLLISSAIGCVSNIVLNIILIPMLSINGAALATLLSYFIMFLVLYLFSQKTYNIPYEWKAILTASFIAAVLYFINIYVSDYIKLSYFTAISYRIIAILSFFLYLYFSKNIKLPQKTA